MIKQSFIIGCVLIIGYAVFVSLIDFKEKPPLHDWEANIIKAQNFLYETNKKDVETVLVGSSLAYRIDGLPANFYNLSFAGLSAYDGMNILLASGHRPKRLLVEANVLQRLIKKDFQEAVSSRSQYNLKKYLPFMRERNRPIPLAINQVYNILYEEQEINAKLKPAKKIESKRSVNEHALAIAQKAHSIPIEDSAKKKIEDELKFYFDEFERKGVEIIFFELPIHSSLCDAARFKSLKEISARFPKINIIEQPDCNQYFTTDGAHLHYESVVKYKNYLLANLGD